MIHNHMLVVGIVLLLVAPCLSQRVCDGFIRGRSPTESFGRLLVNGTLCVLIGSAEKITVINGGELAVLGRVKVAEIDAIGAKTIAIAFGASVTSISSFETSGAVVITSNSRADKLVMKDSGRLRHEGFIGHLTSKNSGNLNITGGVIGNPSSDALIIEEGQQNITLCGANIGNIQTQDSSPRFIAENSAKCAPTNISSLHSVGTGSSVFVKGVSLTGEDSFSAHDVGKVEISSTTFLGKVSMRSIASSISLKSVLVADIVSLIGHQASTTISDSEFKGDMNVGAEVTSGHREVDLSTSISGCRFAEDLKIGPLSGEVKVRGSRFFKGTLDVETRTGGVSLIGNAGLALRVQGNSVGVKVTGNNISDGVLRSNTEVSLIGNRVETLSCVGNNPAPELVDNVVKEGTGQCATA